MNNPLLSIVTGTYKRLDFLRSMIESVRAQIPDGIDYEFVIVDGGSTDGTVEWCAQQSDIHFIQHSKLLGAIKAFTDGANAARGEFVLLANDDVLFTTPGAIVRALAYLDAHPLCGAVAFADDRRAPGYGPNYHVQTIRALQADGHPVDVPYAQVGLFRRALGNIANWWDMHDPRQNTYGGDNYLSARLWELGFTVDAVEGVQVQDRIPQDDLRRHNQEVEQQAGSAYYRLYPNGVQIGTPADPDTFPERMRILYCPNYSPGYPHYKHGLRDALSRVGYVYELDYVAQGEQFTTAVHDWQPHLILTQFHDATTITPNVLAQARRFAPSAVVVNWNGDVYEDSLTSTAMLTLLTQVDLQLVVNAGVLPFYADKGIRAAYWQIGFEPVSESLPYAPSHDLLFQANAYKPERLQLGQALRQISPNTGLYGIGWPLANGNTLYQFEQGAALYRNCKIAIGDNMYGDKGFVSNRLFEALANGAFLLHQHVPGLEELTGLKAGVHYIEWMDIPDLRAKVAQYLPDEPSRRAIASAGEAFVRLHHNFDVRVEELFKLIQGIQEEQDQAEQERTATADSLARVRSALVPDPNVLNWADGIPR